MMSLTTANVNEVVKKQYVFKLKANIDAFSSLVGIQALGILFSIGGLGTYGMSSNHFTITTKSLSADLVIVFTILWAFMTAITLTTRPYRNQDFTFVTNRLSSSLSNVLFLVSASILGGITAVMSSFLIQVGGYFLFGQSLYSAGIVAGELIVEIFATILYILCASSIGYLFGALAQVSKIFIFLIPVLLVGILFVDFTINPDPFITNIYQFFFKESSFVLFLIKAFMTTGILFCASISLLNRMEVRR